MEPIGSLVSAAIGALVVAVGWFVNNRNVVIRGQKERAERISDVQTALRAEIRANLRRNQEIDFDQHLAEITSRIRQSSDYTPFVPRVSNTFVYDAVASDIHILPNDVIDEVVVYYRQAKTVVQLIEDLRGETFKSLDRDRKIAIYGDYLQVLKYADGLAAEAVDALSRSLGDT